MGKLKVEPMKDSCDESDGDSVVGESDFSGSDF